MSRNRDGANAYKGGVAGNSRSEGGEEDSKNGYNKEEKYEGRLLGLQEKGR